MINAWSPIACTSDWCNPVCLQQVFEGNQQGIRLFLTVATDKLRQLLQLASQDFTSLLMCMLVDAFAPFNVIKGLLGISATFQIVSHGLMMLLLLLKVLPLMRPLDVSGYGRSLTCKSGFLRLLLMRCDLLTNHSCSSSEPVSHN